jgi:hypothetical protein
MFHKSVKNVVVCRRELGPFDLFGAGAHQGRPPLNPEDPKVVLASKLFADESVNLDDICVTLKTSKTMLHRYVAIGKRISLPLRNRTQ